MICRGSIGQSIEAILSKVKNINSYLADIITEDSTSADIIKNASIILAYYIGKKNLPLLKKAYEKKHDLLSLIDYINKYESINPYS